MPVNQSSVDNVKRYIGQGELYVNCTKPADTAPVVLTAGVPAGGTYVGLTSGPSELTYTPTWTGVPVEQAYGEIAPRVTKELVELHVKLAEESFVNLQLAVQTGTAYTTGSSPVRRYLTVGGLTFFNTQTIVLVSPLGGGQYEWLALYNALSAKGYKLPYKRGETRMLDITFQAFADVTRSDGDQLFQQGQEAST